MTSKMVGRSYHFSGEVSVSGADITRDRLTTKSGHGHYATALSTACR